MGLKSTLKLLLLFCSLNMILNQINPSQINGPGKQTKTIKIEGEVKDYISLVYTPEKPEDINPTIVISNGKTCKDSRIAMSIQNHGDIYLFIKSSQVNNNQFVVCVEQREKQQTIGNFKIDISTDTEAILPFGKQTSYLVDDQTKNMNFKFTVPDDIIQNMEYATFWAKGKSISPDTEMNGYNTDKIDGGFVFHGEFGHSEEEFLTISCSEKNDYVTVGSVGLDEDRKSLTDLILDGNEVTVASDRDICFPLIYTNDYTAISGKIHNLIARVYFADDKKNPVKVGGTPMEDNVRDGIISALNLVKLVDKNYNKGLLCLDDSPDSKIIVSIQMYSNKTVYFAPPAFPGDIRRYIMLKNQIAGFYGISPSSDATELNYNMKSRRGFPQMYYKDAKNFPNEAFGDIKKSYKHLITSNRMAVYSFYTKDNPIFTDLNSIKSYQPLMVVQCEEGGRIESSAIGEDIFCEFEVTFFSNKDTINIIEESSFSQYLVTGESDHYKVKFPPNVAQDDKVYLDLTIFNGDADIELNKNYKGSNSNKYYLSNKVFYSVHYENVFSEDEEQAFEFNVVAKSNVFYMVNYQVIYKDESSDINTLESGINYITAKNVDDSKNLQKTILLSNFKVENGSPFMATFYSPNCEFSLQLKTSSWNSKTIATSNNYAYEIITKDDNYYFGDNGRYNFTYTITKDDSSEYNKKFCMLYIAGHELNEKVEDENQSQQQSFNGRSISLLEGVPHIFTFTNKYPIVYYSYYISDTQNHLIINFNLLDKAYFDYQIKINDKVYKTDSVYRTGQIYIHREDILLKCTEDMEVCPVEVRVQMRESTRERKVEITMYQLDNNPIYLEKNKVKDDIVNGYFPKHYYFDIGKGECADVVLDYKRGSGFIFGDIQPRKLTKAMKDPDWRGMFKFPMEAKINDKIYYRTYGKKLVIDSEATNDCVDGCYVLITVLTNFEIAKLEDYGKYPLRISLNPRVMSSTENVSPPKVKINVNDFIIGEIFMTSDVSRKYDYYQVTLPFDSDDVFFDWQADSPTLLVNVGENKPTVGKADFQFPTIGDFVYKIPRKKILEHLTTRTDGDLRGVVLTIGIYSDTTDSLESSPYAFKIFLPPLLYKDQKMTAEVIHIRSDQKVQCSPFLWDGNTSLCIFAVVFDDMDVGSNLVVYPRITNGMISKRYGSMVPAEEVETNRVIGVIKKSIEIMEDDTSELQKEFDYEPQIRKGMSYLLVVKVEKAYENTIVDVLTSTYQYKDSMYIPPNPSTAQIFAIGLNKINLYFTTTQDLVLNFASVCGIGAFTWVEKDRANETVFINGIDDRITLTTKGTSRELPTLQIESLAEFNDAQYGFIFYVTYYPRGNVDPLKPNRVNEIHYRTVQMPINYYAPIDFFQVWTVNFNFYKIEINPTKTQNYITYENSLFNIWGAILDDKQIFSARFSPDGRPNLPDDKKIKGTFDLLYGTIFFTPDDVTKVITPGGDKSPNIYINVSPGEGYEGLSFRRIGLEVDAHSTAKEFGDDFIPEGVYISGRNIMPIKIYKLKLKKENPCFKLEYSANSNYVKFILTSNTSSQVNDEFKNMELKDESGRKILNITFDEDYLSKHEYIFLVIFTYDLETNEESSLNYFIFKYMTGSSPDSFISIKDLGKSQVTYTKNGNDYTIKFAPTRLPDTTYFIKAVYTENVVQGENINSIAMSESRGKNIIDSNIANFKEQELTYTINSAKDIAYIKIVAMINFLEEKIIYLYEPIEIKENQQSNVIQLKKQEDIQVIDVPFKSISVVARANDAYTKQKYEINMIGKDKILDYIKIEVVNDQGVDSPTICFSNEDKDCMYNRGQLSIGGVYSTKIFVKKQQILEKKFYIAVECHESTKCSYNITITKESEANFDSLGVYNYYVSENNTIMIFRFQNIFEGDNYTLTAYATGGKNIIINLDDCFDSACKQYNFTDGAAITVKTKRLDYYVLSVKADPGDYISIGLKVFEGTYAIGFGLDPQKGQISGLLRKNVLNMECYSLPNKEDTYFITGNIFEGLAVYGYTNENFDMIKEEWSVASKGYFSLVYDYPKKKRTYMCISFTDIVPENDHFLPYSIQIQTKKTFKSALYTPQYTSNIYSRLIPAGSTAFFSSVLPKVESKYTVYNMFTVTGYPKMFVFLCENYPNCEVPIDMTEGPKFKHVTEINRHSTIFLPSEELGETPIDARQSVLVVKCNQAQGNEKYDYCEVLTSIYGEKDVVQLVEGQPFGQYDTPNDTDQFLIDFSVETSQNFKIHIDFYLITGDVNFEVKDALSDTPINVHKYYLANKIFFSIEINRKSNLNPNLRKIRIDTKARIDSYYTIEYKVIGSSIEQIFNLIYTNINYLVPISPKVDMDNEQKKSLFVHSVKIIRPEIFVVSFYSLNCNLNIIKLSNTSEPLQIPTYGNYAQDYHIHSEKDGDIITTQTYIAYIKDDDKYFVNDNDMCMLYVSGIDLYPEDSGIRKEILISEGVPQKFIFFQDIKKIRYVYPHADPTKNLTYHLNMIVPGRLKLKLFFREKEYNINREYTQTGTFFIYNDWIQKYCMEEDEICTITIEIEQVEVFNGHFPQIEFTIKQVENTPYYIPRGIERRDYITNYAYLFLYTEVGKDTSGYLTVDFNRGGGYVLAKIVKMDQTEADKDPDWRNYRFPRGKNEKGLYYDMYNKKIQFNTADTKDCENGCLMLISIASSVVKQELGDFDFQIFNLIAEFNPEIYTIKKLPQKKIEIYPEEYVIGSLYLTDESEKNAIFEYYSMAIPYDAEEIEIDWQTNIAQLFIKVGEERPNLSNKDFSYTNNGNSIITISKEEILRKYKEIHPEDTSDNIAEIELTFGVYTQYYETFGFTQYAFKVHLQRKELNIYKVSSDQRTICQPDGIGGGKYRCLFIIIYQDTEIFNDLLLYAKSQNPSAILNMYGNYVQSELYDSYDIEKLKLNIPDEGNAKYDTKKERTNFLFLEYGDFNSHAFISVISDKPDLIEFYSSFKTFENIVMPNPSSPQIYSMDIFRKSLVINFMTRKSVSVNIKSLYGEGRFQFHNDQDQTFYLRGDEDNLNYIIPATTESDERDFTLLGIENLRYNNPNYKNPGLAFILEFFLRSRDIQLDSVNMDEAKEVAYKEVDTPVFYYADVVDSTKDVIGYVYLHDLIYNTIDLEQRNIQNNEMEFKGAVVTKQQIYEIKKDMANIPLLSIKGFYDSTLKAGVITIPKANFLSSGQSTLFLALTKADDAMHLKFKSFRGEIGFSTVNGDSVVIQKLYQFGKLEGKGSSITYKLETNEKISNYVRIQFSANSKFVDFAISEKPGDMKNGTFQDFEKKRERGVVFVTFKRPAKAEYLYLTVFAKEDAGNNKLYNYVFKYINALRKELFFEYKIVGNNPKIEVQGNQGKLNVTFNPIEFEQSAGTLDINILYTVKIIKKNCLIPNEKSDHIAITQSEYETAQQFKLTGLDKKTVEINKVVNDFDYAQVIATITQGSIIEYVAYQAVKPNNVLNEPDSNPKPGESGKSSTDGKEEGSAPGGEKTGLYVIIGVSCFLLVVVVALVIVIVMYNSKNKDLLTQVNKISFVQSGASAKDDANLLLDNQNELEIN